MSLAISFFVVLAATSRESQAGLIDTTAGWDGTTGVSPFGERSLATFGQTFTVTGRAIAYQVIW